MISTKDLSALPNKEKLQSICKAISVLDAIICQDWQYRYYSYNSKWNKGEECMQMRDGCGDEMFIMFCDGGCVINGFAHEYKQQDKEKLMLGLPAIYHDFIFGEPVASNGTTFCLWTDEQGNWQTGQIEDIEDNSEEMLKIFDGQPQSYIDYAEEYFEEQYKESGIPLSTVTKIYNGETPTRDIVLSIVDEVEDWNQLKADLTEIGHPFDLYDRNMDIEEL